MTKTFAIIQTTRLPFLILALVCVFLGVSVAEYSNITLDKLSVVLAFIAALLAHISVNMLNEYSDFRSGLDFNTRRTPFSGGSGALPRNPLAARTVLLIGIVSLVATGLIGLYLVDLSDVKILSAGFAGIVVVVLYTNWINRHPFLCLVSPGFGFGLLMVTGTSYVLAGGNIPVSWLAAAIPFFLVNNLLLLNQFPDMQPDSRIGRKNFLIAYGTKAASRMYLAFALAAMMGILVGVGTGAFPLLSLVALVPAPLALYAFTGARKHGDNVGQYPHYLAANVIVTLLMPLLLGISFLAS